MARVVVGYNIPATIPKYQLCEKMLAVPPLCPSSHWVCKMFYVPHSKFDHYEGTIWCSTQHVVVAQKRYYKCRSICGLKHTHVHARTNTHTHTHIPSCPCPTPVHSFLSHCRLNPSEGAKLWSLWFFCSLSAGPGCVVITGRKWLWGWPASGEGRWGRLDLHMCCARYADPHPTPPGIPRIPQKPERKD